MTNRLLAIFIIVFLFSSCTDENRDKLRNNINTSKPYTYWWWQGNAVDSANIAYNLEMMDSAGVGGVHIVPIYGVKGAEDKFLDYLSPEWIKIVKYTSHKARELGMEVDMTLGTGWCYGGSWVEDQNGVMSVNIEIVENCNGDMTIDLTPKNKYPIDTVLYVLADCEIGKRVDLTSMISDQKINIPDNIAQATLYVLRMFGPMTMVKRAAPGAEGPMLNPLSPEAFETYSEPYQNAFQGHLGKYISSIYHDSYEYYNARWSVELLDKFEANRGYKLQDFLPELMDKGKTDSSRRIIADYRQTVFELHKSYVQAIKDWAVRNNTKLRDQAHGSPTNWLDVYPIADIPETESFGSSIFKIPKLERDTNFISISNVPNMDLYKFASSAANVSGKQLVASETHTWLREHFRESLSQCKPELDQLFVSGINHVYYHGTAYSPKEEAWPGWLFYASTNFAPSNSQYCHFSAQNNYIENCQRLLQSTRPDNEIAVYYPFQDILHNCNVQNDILLTINVHNPQLWFFNSEFHKTLTLLRNEGFGYDYISDLQIINCKVIGSDLKTAGNTYKTLIVPKCEYMPIETMQKLTELAETGTNIFFVEDLPEKFSGFSNYQKSGILFEEVKQKLQGTVSSNMKVMSIEKLSNQLVEWENKQETIASYGLDFIRKKDESGCVYFISNLNSGNDINSYITVGTKSKEYIFYDPITGEEGKARVKKAGNELSVLLQLKQGQSLFLFAKNNKSRLPDWGYIGQIKSSVPIEGTWKLDFLEGGPALPQSATVDKLNSWTNLPDTMASYFSGLARYSIDFNFDDVGQNSKYIISFDKVKESVMIRLNGEEIITLVSHPFEADITGFLKKGSNHLELEVANLPANRIRYLDKQKVIWRKFYNINFASINYSTFDASKWETVESGIIGDVSILCYEMYRE